MKPHKSEYWIFPKIEDQEEFVKRIENICTVYAEAINPESKVRVTCSDEKTGIQAISHLKTEAPQKGRLRRIDPEYKRNGTTCLIAGLEVKTGEISSYSQGDTRDEEDYLKHVQEIVSKHPDDNHVIVCDQLNTHKSASLVEWIANEIQYDGDLGIKGKKGILRSMKSRMEFLEDKTHRIKFQFTPKHCSWMNQIENWFGFLQRRVIKNGYFDSVNILESKIEGFIDYYNDFLAKPRNWKFTGEKYRLLLEN